MPVSISSHDAYPGNQESHRGVGRYDTGSVGDLGYAKMAVGG